jgi:hypothetical protein
MATHGTVKQKVPAQPPIPDIPPLPARDKGHHPPGSRAGSAAPPADSTETTQSWRCRDARAIMAGPDGQVPSLHIV